MAKVGKKYKSALQEAGERLEPMTVKDALEKVVKTAYVKFDESVSIDISLGIDPSKGDQVVRGAAMLPHGTGKKVRVLAFVRGDNEELARSAGADYVGAEDLLEKIDGGWLEFDVAVATPDMMGLIGRAAKVLGPKGLLPNKKSGTVSSDIKSIISEIKKGRVSFRNDKGGGVHAMFGKLSFGVKKLEENLKALLSAIRASKPASSKGNFFKKMVISSTMGIGFPVKIE